MSLFDPITKKPVRAQAVTAHDIRVSMRKRWAAPEYAVMWEVGNATGTRGSRYADAVMMSLWPSRGLDLHGVEIKVSRADFKREAADPSKAEAIARYCDRWWIHVGPNVVDDLSAVPITWGVRVFDGRQWKTLREAAKLTPEPMPRSFLAALLRRADETIKADLGREAEKALADKRAAIPKEIEQAVERRTKHFDQLAQRVKAFEEKSGINIDSYQGADRQAEALKLAEKLIRLGVVGGREYNSMLFHVEAIQRQAAQIEEAIKAANAPLVQSGDSQGDQEQAKEADQVQ